MKTACYLFFLVAATLPAADYDKVLAGAPSHDYVVINYDGQSIPPALEAMLRYNSVIRIPAGEAAIEASAGDAADLTKRGSGDWIIQISKEGDAVYAKPTRQSVATNIEIRTDHGNRYPFFISDHSLDKNFHVHLEYIINPTGQAQIEAIKAPPKYVPADKLDDARAEVQKYRTELSDLEAKWRQRFTETQVSTRQDTLSGLVCDYSLGKAAQLFHVQQACHDHDWTYIWAKDAPEHFAIADLTSGSAAMVTPDYDPASGMYTIRSLPQRIRLSVGNGKKTKNADIEKRAGV